MLSNLINNSVDALDSKAGGVVTVSLHADDKIVTLTIQDNGKGMPKDVAEKIMNNIEITDGKEDGHGIGFGQIRQTLQRNEGKFHIDSKVGVGTKIILTFPKIESPKWIADQINISNDDTIVILDDDDSIHGAWRIHFGFYAPNIQLKHFTHGKDAIKFIDDLSPKEKQKIFLLTDYELLRQELHGLHVIEQTGIKRSILVTSHHHNKKVRELAAVTDTKILPKRLASEIPIKINHKDSKTSKHTQEIQAHKSKPDNDLNAVDLIIVDDDKDFVDSLLITVFKSKNVSKYHDPQEFLANVSAYPKSTKICLDNNFENDDTKGTDIAKQLHNMGFTNIYLLSGEIIENIDYIPEYLTVIMKRDLDGIKSLADSL
jgi:hypothetical protein